jgi:response regulator of citrate/malate metabolism
MRALVQMLAARPGQLLSVATLSNELGLGATTVKKYVALLEKSHDGLNRSGARLDDWMTPQRQA